MIVGLGLDLCEIERVEKFLARYGDRFIEKILTPSEAQNLATLTHPKTRAQHLAGRIAAKEAACKALGTGFSGGVHWKCFEVWSRSSGAPGLRVFNGAAQLLARQGVRNIMLSISHDAGVAAAIVIFES